METLSTATLENHKAFKYIFCGLTSIAHTVFLQIKTLFISLHTGTFKLRGIKSHHLINSLKKTVRQGRKIINQFNPVQTLKYS